MSKTDATTKILGFEYQKLVALFKCLEAKEHTFIYLECFGDVSDGLISTEVKHSIKRNKLLNETHPDFWKTLGNFVDEKDVFLSYSKLVLHTTANIKSGSIFCNWKELTSKEKRDKLLAITPPNGIKTHYNKVKKCNPKDLQSLLDKLVIEDNHEEALDYYINNILGHISIVKPVAEVNRETLIHTLLGYITAELIKSTEYDYKWKIDIDTFIKVYKSELKKYLMEDYLFPIVKVSEVDEDVSVDFKFVKELKDIGHNKMIGFAISDYLRAQKSRLIMVKEHRNLSNELDNFDDEIIEDMFELKAKHIDKFDKSIFKNVKHQSRLLYEACLDKMEDRKVIEGVKGVKYYYPKGRIHFNVEESNSFNWKVKQKK